MLTVMEDEFRWSDTRDLGGNRLPGPEHMGRWAFAAIIISLVLHALIYFALDDLKIAFGLDSKPEDLVTAPVNVRQIEVRPYEPELIRPMTEELPIPEESAALLEEIDVLEMLPEDTELDFSPSIDDPEFTLALSNPLAEGDLAGEETPLASSLTVDMSFPDLGRMDTELPPAAIGQITIDPGALEIEDTAFDQFTESLSKRGNEGLVEDGKLQGVESLDSLLDLPPNLLLGKKTLLPSDLIFEFNRADLKETAKTGLMKLALLIDRNPNLYCWIEGHTDLIGSEESNQILSEKRAEAVKEFLVKSMRINPDRIYTRGFGKKDPLVTAGDANVQAPNRRVEIKMRKTPPPEASLENAPKARPVPDEVTPSEPPPKAILVRPNIRPEPAPPRATVVPTEPATEIPRAQPVDEDTPPLRAIPVLE